MLKKINWGFILFWLGGTFFVYVMFGGLDGNSGCVALCFNFAYLYAIAWIVGLPLVILIYKMFFKIFLLIKKSFHK